MPQLFASLLLVISIAIVAWSAWRGAQQYAAFKPLTETSQRQRFYRAWLWKSFALYGAGSLTGLGLIGEVVSVWYEPMPFSGLTRELQAALPPSLVGPEFLGGMVGGGVCGGVILVVLLTRRRGRPAPMLGDVQPLLPRTWRETGWTALLSINAGVTEELWFRLLLPLLATYATGNVLIGFGLATAVFGLAHVYQGSVGVLATTVMGALFAALYLWTGRLVAPIALHILIDLVGLVIRPTLTRLAAARA